jgi:hypothetical protein
LIEIKIDVDHVDVFQNVFYGVKLERSEESKLPEPIPDPEPEPEPAAAASAAEDAFFLLSAALYAKTQ